MAGVQDRTWSGLEPLEPRLLLSDWNFNTLHSFTKDDGSMPSSLVLDGQGNLFGTTALGGDSKNGTVFELSASGTFTTLHSFTGTGTDGACPQADLVLDGQGNLFGTTGAGGADFCGTVFELAHGSSTVTTLYSFTGVTDGAWPLAGLVLDGQGNLFGTTFVGGAGDYGSSDYGYGTVFELAHGSSTVTTLYSFTGETDGASPQAGLVLDRQGNLFGTTCAGGAGGYGTVFELAHGSSTVTTLHSFTGTEGVGVFASRLVLDEQGNLFGTTEYGGASDHGTVFELSASGTFTTLHSFTGETDGFDPCAGLVLDGQGNLFGTTYFGGASDCGTVFELSASGTFTTLHSFTGTGTDGAHPRADLMLDGRGNLFGTTECGGTTDHGTVFELSPYVKLQVPYLNQDDAGWCWATSLAMDLQYNGRTTAQGWPVEPWIIAGALGKGTNDGVSAEELENTVVPYLNNAFAGGRGVWRFWEVSSLNMTVEQAEDALQRKIESILQSDQPVCVGLEASGSTGRHSVVVTGFDGFYGDVFVNDPSGSLFDSPSMVQCPVSWSDFLDCSLSNAGSLFYADIVYDAVDGAPAQAPSPVTVELTPSYTLDDGTVKPAGMQFTNSVGGSNELDLAWDGTPPYSGGYRYVVSKGTGTVYHTDNTSVPNFGYDATQADTLTVNPSFANADNNGNSYTVRARVSVLDPSDNALILMPPPSDTEEILCDSWNENPPCSVSLAMSWLDPGTYLLEVDAEVEVAPDEFVTASKNFFYFGVTASLPDTPTNVTPTDNAKGVGLTPDLTASPFRDVDSHATQKASEWVITRTSDGTVVWDSGTDTSDKTSTTVPAGKLAYHTEYSWQVRYENNWDLWSSYSSATSFTTGVQATTTTLNSTPNPSVYGKPVQFTAHVSAIAPASGTPTGTVTFMAGSTVLGSGTLNSSGNATFSTSALTVVSGGYVITADYSGDDEFDTSVSNSITQTVAPAPLTVIAVSLRKVYGSANPSLSVSYSGLVNGDTPASVPVAMSMVAANSGVGNYPITVSGATNPNYTYTYIDGTLTITPAALMITADNKSKVYGAPNPALTATYTGLVNGDTVASVPVKLSTVAATSGVGAYAISIKASGAPNPNYTVHYVNGILTITKAPLTIKTDNKSKVYGQPNPALTATYTGLVNGDSAAKVPVKLSTVAATSGVGAYAITVSGATNPNYTYTYVNGTLTITPAALTITAVNKSKVYGAPNPTLTPTYKGLVNGDSAVKVPVTLSTVAATSGVGTYAITVSGATNTNYNIHYVSGTLTITKATVTITADSKSKVYGDPNPTLTATYTGLVNGDSAAKVLVKLSTVAATSGVGAYKITVSGATNPNYTYTYVKGTLTITPAALTITADDKSKVHGQPNPKLTVSYVGLVNGDTAAKVPATPSTTASTTSPVGVYPITVRAKNNKNYIITLVNGILTIT
jgi:uncharacterized repeat protein (TIGR03803 family)